jgi:two-component system chemotaxis sensor kinase CheA
MQDKEMLHDLVLESREHLTAIEPDLLELEEKGNAVSDELVNRIFRAVHSIKGGFGFFGLEKVTKLSHAMENVLSRVRDHELEVTPPMIDALLIGIDKLRILLDDVENSENMSIETELETFAPFRDQAQLPTVKETTESHSTDITKEIFEKAKAEGKFLYQITVSPEDLSHLETASLFESWTKLGELVGNQLNIDNLKTGIVNSELSILFLTVLEPDLISTGLEIHSSKIRLINTNAVQNEQKSYTGKQEPEKENPSASTSSENKLQDDTLRVKVQLLNNLMNLAGELVLSRNQLIQKFNRKLSDTSDKFRTIMELNEAIGKSTRILNEFSQTSQDKTAKAALAEVTNIKALLSQFLSFPVKEIAGIADSIQVIDSVTSMLQENIMQTRLQPVSTVFSKFPRIIRDLSRKLGKLVKLEISGQHVELDKSIVELLSDPLTHLIRNSIDHGIESPDDRIKAGKDPTGTIILRAFQEGGKVIVEIQDDGKGIDTERVKEVAIKKGIISDQNASSMSKYEIQMMIMLPGFSTAKQVSDVSGRGVGMDVVKSNIEKLGGSIGLESEFGHGTRISLTLPLTLAIIPSMIISVEDRTFAIPQVDVEELVRIRSFEVTTKIERIQGAEVMRLRGKLLPLVRLASILEITPTFIHPKTGVRLPDKRKRWSDRRSPYKEDQEKKDVNSENRRVLTNDRRESLSNAVKVIVLRSGQHKYGLVVDKVHDSEEIVVKPLSDHLKSTLCYTGATILGDGKVAMILDPQGIAKRSGLKFQDLETAALLELEKPAGKENAITTDVLIFDNNSSEIFGIRLEEIVRIEKAYISEIEKIGEREFLKRDGTSLPLVRLQDHIPVSNPDHQSDDLFVIIPKSSERKLGLVAGKVHDVIQTFLNLETRDLHAPGILGSAIISEKLTILLDFKTLISSALSRYEA